MHYLKADPHELKKQLEATSDIRVILLQIGEIYYLNMT